VGHPPIQTVSVLSWPYVQAEVSGEEVSGEKVSGKDEWMVEAELGVEGNYATTLATLEDRNGDEVWTWSFKTAAIQ